MKEVNREMSFMLRSKEAAMPKKRSGIITVAAFAAGVLLAGYAVFSIVSSNMKINEYEQQYNELLAQTEAVQDSNDEIRRYLEEGADMDKYIEDMARDKLDYARPDERVYYVVPDSGAH